MVLPQAQLTEEQRRYGVGSAWRYGREAGGLVQTTLLFSGALANPISAGPGMLPRAAQMVAATVSTSSSSSMPFWSYSESVPLNTDSSSPAGKRRRSSGPQCDDNADPLNAAAADDIEVQDLAVEQAELQPTRIVAKRFPHNISPDGVPVLLR